MLQQSDPTDAPFFLPFPATQIMLRLCLPLVCGSRRLNSYGERLTGKYFNMLSLAQPMQSALEVLF